MTTTNTATVLQWRVRTVADPNAQHPDHLPAGVKAARVPSRLADRAGHRCVLLAQSPTNGNRLLQFDDGHRVIAPLWSARLPKKTSPPAQLDLLADRCPA